MNLLWLYDIPNWASFLLIVGAALAVGWTGLCGLRPWISHLHRKKNHNEVVGYFWGGMVLFYGVMVGLIAVGAWEQYSSTDEKVALEASSLAVLYREVSTYPQPIRSRLQADLRQYTRDVIYKSWPLQRRRMVPAQTSDDLWRFQDELTSFQPGSYAEGLLHEEVLRAYDRVVELRRMRLHSVQTGLPSAVWVVVVLGAIITISAGWFFLTLSFSLHFWMMTLTSALLGLIIWLLVVMDHPFIGAVSVGPGPFVQVYKTVMASGH